jgi:hypothetical protein
MPDKSMQRIMNGVDQAAKGPLDRMAELRATKADLEKRIAAGQSGDGLKKPDLTVQLKTVIGELSNLAQANPGK